MWLKVENLWTRVAKASGDEVAWLRSFLSYEDAAKERAVGDGTVKLLDRRHRRFQTGLVPMVERNARKAGFEVKRIDRRQRPGPHVADALEATDLEWLKTRMLHDKPYQFDAIAEALRAGRGIVRAPTGAGKGEMVVGMAKALPIRWLFLVHRSHLAEDIHGRWEKRGDGSGSKWISSGDWELGERITFCTFQTLYRSLGDPDCRAALAQVQGAIIDECHVIPAESFMEVSEALTQAYYRIGLSGTPLERGDGKSLMAIAQTGPVVYNVVPRDLMEAGYVAKATVRLTTIEQTGGGGTWAKVRKALLSESRVRNAAVVRDVLRAEKPAMVFIDLLSHGRIVRDALKAAGVECEFVWGKVGKDQRKELVHKLNTGQLDVLVANDVFREGVDAPNIRAVINAAGGKSTIATIQRVGRGSRVTEDKTEFEIYDYRDRGQRWLAHHAVERIRTYQKYGYSVVDDTSGPKPVEIAPEVSEDEIDW